MTLETYGNRIFRPIFLRKNGWLKINIPLRGLDTGEEEG